MTAMKIALLFLALAVPLHPAERLTAPCVAMIGFTGSMRPAFKGGEFVRIAHPPFSSLRAGQIGVMWRRDLQENVPHTIIRVGVAANGQRYAILKGDANPQRDPRVMTEAEYVGVVEI